MAKKYKGSLTLDWFNKQKAIVNLDVNSIKGKDDIPAPRINWINKEEALFYELNEEEGKGNTPYWVNRDDIRVKEARPLIFQKAYKAVTKEKEGSLPGIDTEYTIQEITNEEDTLDIDNMLIKGDNLLALNTLKKHFDKLPDSEKVKCVFIDPPYNTGEAFEHYDDNLETSEWLTLMRDRLNIIQNIISDSGFVFVILDEKYHAYLKVLLDEAFGKDNFLGDLIWRKRKGGGNDSTFMALDHDYICCYAKNKENPIHKNKYRVPYEGDYLKRYKEVDDDGKKYYWDTVNRDGLKNPIPIKLKCPDGSFININSQSSENTVKDGLISGHMRINKSRNGWTLHHRIYMPAGKVLRSLLLDSGTNKDSKDEQRSINKDDEFDYPKPEVLLKRILDFSTSEGDLVLDCFGGSGTTFSTAHKMNRKWIGNEIGDHADTHIIPRIKGVIDGSDKIGITDAVNWKGGGSFKYYHLGESIINIDKETDKGEFNWVLGKQFIQESLLVSYDFVLQEDINLFPAQLFPDKAEKPSLGKISNKGKAIYGVSFLAAPKDKDLTITNEDIKTIYSTLKKQDDFQSVVIYTNKGIDIAQDTIPVDLEIIKVPHAIFAELER